jgi:hypothetical protein
MLTDIFAYRYAGVRLWQTFGEPERRLLAQGFRILTEHICSYWADGKEYVYGKNFWTDLHKRLSMELGLSSLSPLAYAYSGDWMGKSHTTTSTYTIDKVCENWVLRKYDNSEPADSFIKERLSLVEIGFRKRGEDIAAENALLPQQIAENRLRATRKGA